MEVKLLGRGREEPKDDSTEKNKKRDKMNSFLC
jgi:hypothetical protein